MAVANPSPLVAPVMRTVFPLIDISLCGTALNISRAKSTAISGSVLSLTRDPYFAFWAAAAASVDGGTIPLIRR